MHTRLIFRDRSVIILEGTESVVALSDVIESSMLRQRAHATQDFQEKLEITMRVARTANRHRYPR